MEFPTVTICNWNSLLHCDTCNLTLVKAYGVNSDGELFEAHIPHHYMEVRNDKVYFKCLVFNHDGTLPAATATGYGGSYSLFFEVPRMPKDILNRNGLQVSFHEVGTIAPVLAETNFARGKVDNFFVLTKFQTTRLATSVNAHTSSSESSSSTGESSGGTTTTHGTRSGSTGTTESTTTATTTTKDPLIETRWESSLSVVELSEYNETTVVVSFAYATLNQNEIDEVTIISITETLGEIGAVIGFVMGVDVIKIVRGLLEIPYSIKERTLRNIWNVFN